MSGKAGRLIVAGALAVCVSAFGCAEWREWKGWDDWKTGFSNKPKSAANKSPGTSTGVPPEVSGTVAEYAGLVGGGSLLVDGHGLVVGLGKYGSSEVPPMLRKYLDGYMRQRHVGSAIAGTSHMQPASIMADLDTALVRVLGVIPPGVPKGWKFDVRVAALARTGTRSLDGGVLYPFPMHMASGEGQPPTTGARKWAMAQGSVFINPFLEPNNPKDTVRLREGRVIGGGTVIQARPLRLMLREADYAQCNAIQRRINARFSRGGKKVANARNPATLELNIPPAFADDYQHFLELVMHLPLQSDPKRWEARAVEIGHTIEKPGVNAEGLALVWEAMGPQIVNSCRQHYASKNPAASFYSARSGIRLMDESAGDILVRIAQTTGSKFQVPAIVELGKHRRFYRSRSVLRSLLDDKSDLVRIAAYETLVKLGDTAMIQRRMVGEFEVDMIKSSRNYVIYATQSHHKRIALFGRDMQLAESVFFDMPDPFNASLGLVTIADKMVDVDPNGNYANLAKMTPAQRQAVKTTRQRRLMLFRSIPRTGGISPPFYTDFRVSTLIDTLGNRAVRGLDWRIKGMDLTYGQVVAVLYRMCEVDKCIPAKFVLQHLPGRETIYRDTTTVGRPDMPGE